MYDKRNKIIFSSFFFLHLTEQIIAVKCFANEGKEEEKYKRNILTFSILKHIEIRFAYYFQISFHNLIMSYGTPVQSQFIIILISIAQLRVNNRYIRYIDLATRENLIEGIQHSHSQAFRLSYEPYRAFYFSFICNEQIKPDESHWIVANNLYYRSDCYSSNLG